MTGLLPTPRSLERRLRRYAVYQFLILGALVTLSLLNELADLPHRWLGATPTPGDTRWAEIEIEAAAFLVVAALQIFFLRQLQLHIRVLHGLLPVCQSCRRIHHDGVWLEFEHFITEHSMAFFYHTTCPQCREEETLVSEERGKRGTLEPVRGPNRVKVELPRAFMQSPLSHENNPP